MGSCLGAERSRSPPRHGSSRYPAMGKNQSLRKEQPKWKNDVPMTEGQLRSKRDEFWDTAPAFEGQKEIWDALKAAAMAMESGDNGLAQAIIDGANITLPNGTLMDCYDELGAHYQLPVYCLSSPMNLIKDEVSAQHDAQEELSEIQPNDKTARHLRIRLSTEREVKLKVLATDSISVAKRRLDQKENLPVATQRWFFAGKMLTDGMRIEQCKLEKGYVVQCIIMEQS